MPVGGAIAGSAAIGGVSSYFGGKQQADATRDSANIQLQAAREAIAAQKQYATKAFDVFKSESSAARNFLTQQNRIADQRSKPLYEFGLNSLKQAQSFTDPNSALSQQERDVFGRTLAANLSARGLTGSGTEIAGLSNFEVGLAEQRRNLALNLAGVGAGAVQNYANQATNYGQGLAGISQNLAGSGANIFGNLGQNIGSTLQNYGNQASALNLAAGQARAQGLIGVGNAFQTGLLGLSQYSQSQNAQAAQTAQYNQLLDSLRGGGRGQSSNFMLSQNLNSPFN